MKGIESHHSSILHALLSVLGLLQMLVAVNRRIAPSSTLRVSWRTLALQVGGMHRFGISVGVLLGRVWLSEAFWASLFLACQSPIWPACVGGSVFHP